MPSFILAVDDGLDGIGNGQLLGEAQPLELLSGARIGNEEVGMAYRLAAIRSDPLVQVGQQSRWVCAAQGSQQIKEGSSVLR